MQAKSLLLGAFAGLSLAILSLSVAPALASAKAPAMLQQYGNPSLITQDNDNIYIVQDGVAYKVNKLQMHIMSRAYLRSQ